MNLFAFTSLLCGFSSLALAVFTLVVGKTKAQRLFTVFNAAVSVWGFGNFAAGIAERPEAAMFAWRIAYLGGVYISTLFCHLVLKFFEISRKRLLLLAYLHSILFTLIIILFPQRIIHYTRFVHGIHYNAITIPMAFAISAYLIIVGITFREIWVYLKSAIGQKKIQAKYFIGGFGFGFIGGATTLLPVFGIDVVYPMGNLGVAFYVFVLLYAIFKHQALDIRIVIQKVILYTFWTLFVSAGYALAIFFIQNVFIRSSLNVISPARWVIPNTFYVWSGAIALMMNSGMAMFVYAQEAKKELNIKFALFSLCIGLWAAGSWFVNIIPDKEIALWVLRANYAFGVFIPVLFLDFVIVLTGREKKFYLRLGYMLSISFVLLDLTSFFIKGLKVVQGFEFYISDPGVFYYLFFIYFCVYLVIALTSLYGALSKAAPDKKRQLWYVFFAYFVGMVAGVEYFCSVFGILKRPPVDDYILIITFLILSYAIVKHELLDIRLVIKRTLFYSLLASIITSFYVLVIFIVHTFILKEPVSMHYLINSAVLILLIAIFLRPLETFLHRRLDKRFFKGTIEEISEQKARLETELERRERLKSVGILAAGMAHEIKNPLTAINTFADYLPTKYDDPEFREKFHRIVKQEVARVRDIVSDLLLFSKPSEPTRRECDLSKILADISDLLSSEMFKVNIRLVHEKSVCLAFVDPDQIKQAFLNIFMNAIDAMKAKGGELRIQTRLEWKYAEVSVRDSGSGISEDKLKHIFDPFYTSKEHARYGPWACGNPFDH